MEKPIITEKELKTLKLFSYYIRSHGIKQGSVDIALQNCEIDYIDNFYDKYGSRAELYDAIEEVLTNIIENNKIYDYLSDCDNYGTISVNIDCVERTLELEVFESVMGYNEMFDVVNFDELDDFVKGSLNDLISQIPDDYFEVIFHGSGDSGEIETSTTNGYNVDGNILDFLYKWLESFYGGWEINEGSQGNFIFDVEKQIITLNFNENTEETISRDIDFQIKF